MKSTSIQIALKRIGSKLSALRIKKGYNTIKEFTTDYKLPLIQYWRIEKGKANITLKTLIKVLSIHKIALEDFFCVSTDLTTPATGVVMVNRKKSIKFRR
jgi:transcriptional regulator with XRE-family HTH domain